MQIRTVNAQIPSYQTYQETEDHQIIPESQPYVPYEHCSGYGAVVLVLPTFQQQLDMMIAHLNEQKRMIEERLAACDTIIARLLGDQKAKPDAAGEAQRCSEWLQTEDRSDLISCYSQSRVKGMTRDDELPKCVKKLVNRKIPRPTFNYRPLTISKFSNQKHLKCYIKQIKKQGQSSKRAKVGVARPELDKMEVKMWQMENQIDRCNMTRKIMNQFKIAKKITDSQLTNIYNSQDEIHTSISAPESCYNPPTMKEALDCMQSDVNSQINSESNFSGGDYHEASQTSDSGQRYSTKCNSFISQISINSTPKLTPNDGKCENVMNSKEQNILLNRYIHLYKGSWDEDIFGHLVSKTGLSATQINSWFQNQKQKEGYIIGKKKIKKDPIFQVVNAKFRKGKVTATKRLLQKQQTI